MHYAALINSPRWLTRTTHTFVMAALLAVLAVPSFAMAAAEATGQHPMRFGHVTLDDGLSQSNIFTILQDSQGLMWFGTENGLNSYDGYQITTYKRERGNSATLGSDYIYDLAESADGTLWIATNGGGLARKMPGESTFTNFRHDPENSSSIASNIVRTLLVNDDGTIWLGTRGAGLDLFDPATGEFTHHNFSTSGKSADAGNEIFVLHKDSNGALWVGSNLGLIRIAANGDSIDSFRNDPADPTTLSDNRVRSVLSDSEGRLWVGTYGGGLNLLNERDNTFTRFQHDPKNATSIANDRVTTVFEDNDGRLWAGTSGGLNLINADTGTFVRYAHDATDSSSLGDNGVTALYQDTGGLLWVGTRYRGLSKWDPDTWAYGLQTGKSFASAADVQPNVTAFAVDAEGTLWVGTFGEGLNAIDRTTGEVRRYRHDPSSATGLSDNRVMSLLLDSRGSLWIGTMTGGLNRLDLGTGQIDVFRHDAADASSISANGIMSLFEDSYGRVWAGTFGGGISRFDADTGGFVRYTASRSDADALSSARVTAFAEDASGKLWVGTDGGGLNLLDTATGKFHSFRHDADNPQSLSADTVHAISIDKAGSVWVGTRGGLDQVVGSANDPANVIFANLSQRDGLANDVVYGVQFDAAGTIWMSTNYGISKFDPQSRRISNLHRKDGLQSEEFNFGAHYRSADGELFFGGHNGYNAFQPDEIVASSVGPAILLTGAYNGDEPIKSGLPDEEGEGFEVAHNADNLSFEFAALDFSQPSANQYRYKLEGFDKEWIDLGTHRRVTYTDLNDGSYLLRVQAANSDGVWNEAGLSIPLRVKPALWDTWWAYLGYVAVFAQLVAMLWVGHRRKIAREEEYSRRLEFEVRQRTDQLLTRNKQLNQLNQSLQQSSLSDPLTGLRNRRFVFEEVSRDLEVARRKHGNEQAGMDSKQAADLVFMMIDLDNFKPINDTFGHAAGDAMLLQVRDVLLGACRRSDFVIRWGGDEFVVIAKQAMPGESEALAERIRSRIASHNFVLEDGQLVRTTCSLGFAQYPLFRGQQDEADLDQILGLADSLMYEAKKRRDAWAGLLGPTEAATSFEVNADDIDPSSLLFRAKRAGSLITHQDSHDAEPATRLSAVK